MVRPLRMSLALIAAGLVAIALVVTYTRLRRPNPIVVRIVVVAVVLFPVTLYVYDLALRSFVAH